MWFIPVLILVAAFVLLWWLMRPVVRCPECGSQQCGLVSKEPLGMRESSFHGGGEGGGYTAVQLAYKVRYQCNECGESWEDTITETR